MNTRAYRRLLALCLTLALTALPAFSLAHSGRTDSRGGHKDNKNKSGLGSYHFHCGGFPAHLHPGGVCPYSSNGTSSGHAIKATSVRQKPDSGSKKLGQLAKGDEVVITEAFYTPSWHQIIFGDKVGYIYADYCDLSDEIVKTVAADAIQ